MATCVSPLLPPDQKKVCCVFNYDAVGRNIGGTRTCTPIGDNLDGQDQNITEAECLAGVVYNNAAGAPLPPVPYGEIKECCRDCNPPAQQLVLRNGRLVRNGNSFAMSAAEEPEKCCCGDECACQEVPGGCKHVRCYNTKITTLEEKCRGRCIIKTYYDGTNVEDTDLRQAICETQIQCCADDNTTCESTCNDGTEPTDTEPGEEKFTVNAANTWDAIPCTTCGVCCVNNYDLNPESEKFREVLDVTGVLNRTQAECEALAYFELDPQNPLGPVGTWHANTDNINICNPICCQTRNRGSEKEVTCGHTSAKVCNPCVGRCVEVARENNQWLCPRAECKTRQQCCGDGNEKCVPQCGSTQPQYRWETVLCGTDSDKCGTCCQYIWDPQTQAGDNQWEDKVCNPDIKTRADCEKFITLESGVNRQNGIWYPFETCVACKAVPCCRTVTCPDGTTSTICVNVAESECNVCNGTCTDLATGNQSCASYQACCGPDGINCRNSCGVAATYQWNSGCADYKLCGACCRLVFDSPNASANLIEAQCLTGITKLADCTLTEEDTEALRPDYDIRYSWRPFKTCADAKCDKKTCCGEKCPGDVGCVDVNIDVECNPCHGRCAALLPDGQLDPDNPPTCKTKQECCGPNGVLCLGCPGPDGPGPSYQWDGCFENGFKCGVCCVLTLDAEGRPISSECHDDFTYEQCRETPNGHWKPFETCASAVCIPRLCCNDVICPDQTVCVALDKDRGECDDWCRGECYAIDETGLQTDPSFCATKVDCCGPLNERCTPQPGLCPGSGNTIPTHIWPNECADPELCGICCKKIKAGGVTVGFECDPEKTTATACSADDYGAWISFGTCTSCVQTKQACVETRCRKIVNINGEQTDVTYTHAQCRPVAPDQTTCKGICTEFATPQRPYEQTTCKTKSECCGADNNKCGSCGIAATHSWAAACIDPEKCGACCIITEIGDGDPTVTCQENIGRDACALLGAAGGGDLGVTTFWRPLGACRDCSIERCCGQCPDNSIQCVDVLPPETCLKPCNGKCYAVDALGNVDLTVPATCKTKEECCIQGGINVCRNGCLPGNRWQETCPENSTKCGVACKITYGSDGTTIISSDCMSAINTYAKYEQAVATKQPTETFIWKPWESCNTVLCRTKKCCKEKCPGVFGCVDVDYDDPCEKCQGLCYDADVDPVTGAHTKKPGAVGVCSARADCCGAKNEKCAEIQGCLQENPKVFEPCCPDDVFQPCLCADAKYQANRTEYTSPLYDREPPATGYEFESCSARLDGANPGAYFDSLFLNRLYYADNAVVQTYTDPCAANGPLLPTYNYKECYPELLGNQPIYIFRRTRYGVGQIYPRDGSGLPTGDPLPGQESYHELYQHRIRFYICQGKKLVDVSNAILTANPIPTCRTATNTYTTLCAYESMAFGACDYPTVLGHWPTNGEDLGAFGAPGYKFVGATFGTNFVFAFIGWKIRRKDQIYGDLAQGLRGGLDLLPYQADCPATAAPFVPAGAERPIFYRTVINPGYQLCGPIPTPTVTKTPSGTTTLFENTWCRKLSVEWDDNVIIPAVPQAGPLTVPEDCCRAVKFVDSQGLGAGACTHDWRSVCAGNWDDKIIDDDMIGCPQEFQENPLP